MGKLSAEERPIIGQLANEIRADIEARLPKRALKSRRMNLKKDFWAKK